VTLAARPHFDRPPVTEVRLSISYDRLPKLRSAHAGLLWAEVGGPRAYPAVEDLYREPAAVEEFGTQPEPTAFDVALFDRPRATRVALRSADQAEAVELQDDQLTVLWSATPGGAPYPRYEYVRGRFNAVYSAWQRIVQEQELGELRPRQAEIAYVNHLPVGVGWHQVADVPAALNLQWLPAATDLVTEVPEDLHLYQRYVLERAGQPYGRLYVSLDTARTWNGEKAMALSLTVRGRPRKASFDGTLEVLDDGHEIITSSFVSVTSEQMHERWGRT